MFCLMVLHTIWMKPSKEYVIEKGMTRRYLWEKEGHTVDKKYVSIVGGNIKRLGLYTATVRLHREASADIEFEVVAQA